MNWKYEALALKFWFHYICHQVGSPVVGDNNTRIKLLCTHVLRLLTINNCMFT